MLTVEWTDRQGAQRLCNFIKKKECANFLSKLRRPATVHDSDDRVVGGIEYAPGEADDKRIKWAWWLEE